MKTTVKPSILFNLTALVLLLAYPVYSLAVCTYTTQIGSGTTVASCNETTELAPTLVTEGKSLDKVRGVVVMAVRTGASGAMTAGGKLNAWLYSPSAGMWVRTPDLDVTAAAQTNQAWTAMEVMVPRGRIDYRPSALGAGNTLVYIHGYAP
jgi:hypothetical protein